VPLVARPAGVSHLAESGDPRLSAILAACVGLLIGLVVAVAVLSIPPVSGSVIATVLWVWLAALISAAYTLGRGASWATAGLGLLPFGGIWLPVTLLVPAVLIALVVAAIARFGGVDLRAVAACGLAGPALVGLAYLVAGPGGGSQTTAYRYALLAVCAGFAVSALAAVLRRRRPTRRTALPEPAATAEPLPTWERAPEAETSPTGLGAVDYGWPEPETAESATSTDQQTPEPGPATPTKTGPAAAVKTDPATATPAKATKAASRRKAPAKATKAATAPAAEPAPPPRPEPAPKPPAARPVEPPEPVAAPEPAPAADIPAKAARLGRRGRRDPEPQPGKPAKPPRVSKAEARENDHVDWVKSLGGGPSIRVGGTEAARHARSGDSLDPLDDDV